VDESWEPDPGPPQPSPHIPARWSELHGCVEGLTSTVKSLLVQA